MLAEVNFLALTAGEVLMPSLKLPNSSSTTLLPSAMLAEISVIRALITARMSGSVTVHRSVIFLAMALVCTTLFTTALP